MKYRFDETAKIAKLQRIGRVIEFKRLPRAATFAKAPIYCRLKSNFLSNNRKKKRNNL